MPLKSIFTIFCTIFFQLTFLNAQNLNNSVQLETSLASSYTTLVPSFKYATDIANLKIRNVSYSACAGDLNDDDYLDLIVSYHSYFKMYINKGDGTFKASPVYNLDLDNHGVSMVDFNNDYKLDVSVSIGSMKGQAMGTGNTYYTFNDDSLFYIADLDSSVLDFWGRGRVNIPTDFNKDGIIDQLLLNFNSTYPGDNYNRIFLGNSKKSSLLKNYREIYSEKLNDLNATSIIISNLFNNNKTYIIAERGGRDAGKVFYLNSRLDLLEVTSTFKIKPGSVMQRILVFDYDNDADMDLLYLKNGFEKRSDMKNAFYENTGNNFIQKDVGLNGIGKSIDAVIGDYNNDGFTDVYLLNANKKTKKERSILFLNNGKKEFLKVNTMKRAKVDSNLNKKGNLINGQEMLSCTLSGKTNGGITFDYDNDGALDIFVHNGKGKFSGNNLVLRNTTKNIGNYLKIKLKSTVSNSQSWGARVVVSSSNGEQLQEKTATNSKLGVSDIPFHFGLGNNSTVDVTIYWPSGKVDTYNEVKANQLIEFVEKVNKK